MYDRLLVNPSIELKPNLEFLYQQWLVSQKILMEVHSLCSELPLEKVKAGLENALMRRVLDMVEPNPMDQVSRCRRFGVWVSLVWAWRSKYQYWNPWSR